MTNYYDILGVDKEASVQDIKKAYRRLSLKYHPDKANNDDELKEFSKKFKEINQAYQILFDTEKRKQYDAYGNVDFDFNNYQYSNFADEIFENIFGSFFHKEQNTSYQDKINIDIHDEIVITFEESILGTSKKINIKYISDCKKCDGVGGKSEKICKECNGTGRKKYNTGIFNITSTCDKCEGKGKILSDVCNECNGKGINIKNKEIKINIPEKFVNGDILRIKNEGHIYKGKQGDILLTVRLKKHNDYQVMDMTPNIIKTIKINCFDLILGKKIEINSLENKKINLEISPSTSNGQIFRFSNKGLYYYDENKNKNRGDMMIRVISLIPDINKLSDENIENLKKIRKEYDTK